MNEELYKLIIDYQKAVKTLFPRVAEHLKVKLPITNIEWSGLNKEQREITPCGINYCIHGYGISMDDGNVKVDFDLGSEGRINRFDAWRLAGFVEDKNIKATLANGKNIEEAIKRAESDGEIKYSGYILYFYYVTNDL